jgi:3-hydroxybutyryl-CoA dehydratase
MIGVTIQDLTVGDHAELTRVATEADIAGFVDSVGDYNPVHTDRAYAAGTRFKGRIAPGIWTAGLISAVIGTRLPGPGTIYLSQDLAFLRPVMLGDTITARAEVMETNREKNRVRLHTSCVNQRGEAVLEGEALVMPSRTPVRYARPADAAALTAAWTLVPWAWAVHGVAVAGMLGLGALALAWPRGNYIKRPPLMESSAPVM